MSDDKTYHHGNLKQALVRAGLEILEAEGLEALSLRACAERAGVSHAAPRNHFGNLRGLLSAIAAEGIRGITRAMQGGLPAGAKTAEARMAAFRGYVAYAKAHPALFELMFSRRRVDFDDPAMREPLADCAAILRRVSQGMIWTEGGTAEDDLRAQMLNWSLVHGFAQLSLQGVFDKEGMRDIGITDILPDIAYRGEAG